MADGKIKISELSEALQINNDAVFPYSQDNGGTDATFGAPMTQLARKVTEGVDFTNLETSNKKIVGAINQTLNNFAEEYDTTETYNTGDPTLYGGTLYKCKANNVTGTWDSTKWEEAKAVDFGSGGGGGSGGHTILDDSGTSLTQRTNLQFLGAYSEDNSTDNTTEVNVVREMTKAEFDLLSADEKVGFINITDITGGNDDRFQPVIYSEDEREIGVWKNGKPLYQKTVVLSDTDIKDGSYQKYFDLPIDNLDEIAKFEPTLISTSVDAYPLPYVNLISGNDSIYIGYFFDVPTTTYQRVQLRYGNGITSNYFGGAVVTIYYTKTTDVAGSGTWTPQGVPAVHYSADEHVVGTWVDGSTLYEKTQYGGISITTADIWYDTSITGVDKTVMVSGSLLRSGEEVGLGTFNSRWILRNNNVKISLSDLAGDTWSLMSITVQYTKSST